MSAFDRAPLKFRVWLKTEFEDLGELRFDVSPLVVQDLQRRVEEEHKTDVIALFGLGLIEPDKVVKLKETQTARKRQEFAQELGRILEPTFRKLLNDVAEKLVPE